MHINLNKKNCLLLAATMLSTTYSNAIDLFDSPEDMLNRNKVLLHNAHRLLNKAEELKEKLTSSTLKATNAFIYNQYNLCARYGKIAAAYSAYSFSGLLKGLSYSAKIGSVSSFYSSKLFGVIGMLDEVGKDMSTNAYGLTHLGINILGSNYEAGKKSPNTYLSNIIYGVKETAGISSVIGGGFTHGLGVCSRILGLTGKVAKTVSYSYVSPSLASIGNNLSFAANGCDSFSQSLFKSL